MRWSIVRLIWLRELRDQLRDRRTVFMIAVLPVLLYPVAGFGVVQLAFGFLNQRSVVGVQGADELLGPAPPAIPKAAPAACWLTLTPGAPGVPLAGAGQAAAAAGLFVAVRSLEYPPLLVESERGRLAFAEEYLGPAGPLGGLEVRRLGPAPAGGDPEALLERLDRSALEGRAVDVLLVAPEGFRAGLERGGRPVLYVVGRDKDESARLVVRRVESVLRRWKADLRAVRLARRGLPADFDDPFGVYDPEGAKPAGKREEEGLFALLVRVFPFVLVMWSLAGALYPAVDLCAGEKERGTMETLLVSPASREEIVWGKFLTIWVFSAATALLNLLSMAFTTWQFSGALPGTAFSPLGLFWGVVLLLPLSAFFSAVCLAVGAYARSSKEGQYYLMPLFLVTMPLIFLTLAPGVELNPFYSMVPVTGVALLLQRLMAGSADRGAWLYFVPVLAPMVIYGWLALRWAVAQFRREEVLFREAERLDLGLWLRGLLRDKEMWPSAGQAFFCFGLILALRWLSLNAGTHLPLLTRTAVGQLAFVATPPLFMAALLTTRPRQGLGLRRPPGWAWPASALLALLVLPPLAGLTGLVLEHVPGLRSALEEGQPLLNELRTLSAPTAWQRGRLFVALVLLPGVCEEVAFRGFILSGLRRGYRPWAAVALGAFLFALYHMNVFQFFPPFLLGVALGLLVVRAGSVLPAVAFHLVYNTALFARYLWPEALAGLDNAGSLPVPVSVGVGLGCAALAAGVLAWVWACGRPVPGTPEPEVF